MTRSLRAIRSILPLLLAPLGGACDQVPTTSVPEGTLPPIQLAPPNCGAEIPLSITMRDAAGDSLFSDGGGAYVEGVAGVQAHINDPTGRLSIWTTQSPRYLQARYKPLSGGPTDTVHLDRVYTNTHNTACSLVDIPVGGSGTAVLEAERRQFTKPSDPNGDVVAMVEYGKSCSGSVVGPLVNIAHPDANTWVITGTSGSYCTLNSRKKLTLAGSVGPFEMTLVK